jgi:hypothetical protein
MHEYQEFLHQPEADIDMIFNDVCSIVHEKVQEQTDLI